MAGVRAASHTFSMSSSKTIVYSIYIIYSIYSFSSLEVLSDGEDNRNTAVQSQVYIVTSNPVTNTRAKLSCFPFFSSVHCSVLEL